MFRNKKVEEKFLNISREHKLILPYLKQFDAVIDQGVSGETFALVRDQFDTLHVDLYKHFEIEELFLFPTALMCDNELETVDLVLKLQKEHGYFENDMQRIREYIQYQDPDDPKIHEPLYQIIQRFTENMRTHADEEMCKLFPLLDKNKRAQKIIKGFVVP